MTIIGIDPGKKGAVALLAPDLSLRVFDISDWYDDSGAAHSSVNPNVLDAWLHQQFGPHDSIKVYCEKPIFVGGGFTIKTPMSMFESYGVLRAVFTKNSIPFIGVHPREWQKWYTNPVSPKQKRGKRKRDKNESIVKAKEIFPAYADLFERTVEKGAYKGNVIVMDGRAEAALIAWYGRALSISVPS